MILAKKGKQRESLAGGSMSRVAEQRCNVPCCVANRLLLVVAATSVGFCDAMRRVFRLCRDAVTTQDQVLSGAGESRGRYEPPTNTAVPLRVPGWRGSFQWGKLVGGAAGEGVLDVSAPSRIINLRGGGLISSRYNAL
ncbi:hypothetical protein FOXG_17953 [Fusarium oxysporum f. sp. lycopersici 4287]|uniref:Uncharacterized protein n=2 Tax=Fusarium oxysporum TaxID=5507 RepID=A0A0J9WGH9_FUSO4|nr:hypothetical protein FOXG_17953 [Fusarium oxysporum f. sp. lycopersici 4287]EXK48759.1 hypothetical protein FOMG_01556 [Fusarium oxysporum f. sp. melonis 26406]KNA95061.1 hypothetical protein FOXG_17953 [Fusarium oxysporum f. sp. lycopersici 4287]